jgi:hypothetical protein
MIKSFKAKRLDNQTSTVCVEIYKSVKISAPELNPGLLERKTQANLSRGGH